MSPIERSQKLASIPLDEAWKHHDWLRLCFEKELAARLGAHEDGWSSDHCENIYHCALLLHLINDLDDLPLLYSAKCSGDMDLGCGFDFQFLFMREPEALKAWAKSKGREDIAQWVESHEDAYREEDMEQWRNWIARYHRPK